MIQSLTALGLSNIQPPDVTRSGAAAGPIPSGSFSDMLTTAAGRGVEALRGAENLSIKALSGDVDAREVVDAVMSAEQSLQAAVAIRDKIVAAYLEVSRMAI